jgi:hypothetical protein
MMVMSFSGRALYFNQRTVLLPSAPRRFNLNTIAFDGWKIEIKRWRGSEFFILLWSFFAGCLHPATFFYCQPPQDPLSLKLNFYAAFKNRVAVKMFTASL